MGHGVAKVDGYLLPGSRVRAAGRDAVVHRHRRVVIPNSSIGPDALLKLLAPRYRYRSGGLLGGDRTYSRHPVARATAGSACPKKVDGGSLRHELYTIILSKPEDVAGFNRVAESLGLDPTVPRVAFAAELRMPEHLISRNEAELERIVLGMARLAKTAPIDLVQLIHRDRLIIWFPCIRGDSLLASDKRMGGLAERLIASVAELARIGVGMMGQGSQGWAVSMDEALRALEMGGRNATPTKVHRYSDIVLYEGARRSDNVLRYLQSLIERLSHEPDLLRTLECYLDQFQRRKRTASDLGIHPNTLNYRLQRIQEMTGADLQDPAWLSKLHIAVRLRQGSC